MLKITNIKKIYKTAGFTQVALDNVSITFRENEFAAILGPSGSGKTTLLNIIGGLDHYDDGDLIIDGISTKQYKDRDWDTYRNNRIGFVFQAYNLIPHQTILANVELALTLSGVSTQERRKRATDALAEVGLKDHIHKKPNQLSGGQMQRVAIARALVNDPSILLADEPTGALDSKTSLQVMEMLKEVAKDRLVIMVTHNPELANQYANRIVTLKDGHIIDDTNPYQETKITPKPAKVRKASMSYLTALSLSFSNLMTKKGRTFVTALAGSIGIIGIALILALANGINVYIDNVQKETLSIYPLSIQKTGMNMGSSFNNNTSSKQESSDGEVKESAYLQRMFYSQSQNDLKSLKTYIDQNKSKLAKNINSIEYKYDVTPQIYLGDSQTVDRVNPDTLLNSYGMGSNNAMSSIMSSVGMSASMSGYNELPGDLSLYRHQYDVLAGTWPKNYDEAVLVLDNNGRVSDFQLYEMGFKDRSELKTILDAITNQGSNSNQEISGNTSLSYDELMSADLKVVKAVDQYQYNSEYSVWVDKSSDTNYMKPIIDQGISLKIVGVVKPESKDTVTSLSSGVYYTPELVNYLIEQTKDAKIITDQQANPEINVFTNKSFVADNESKNAFDFSSIISIDEGAMQSAFNFDTSKIKINPGNLNLNGVSSIAPPSIDVNGLVQTIASQLNIPTEAITKIINETITDFIKEETDKGVTDLEQLQADLNAYFARADVQAKLETAFSTLIDPTQIQNQINQTLQSYLQSTMSVYVEQLSTSIQNAIQSYTAQAMSALQKQLPQAFSIDQNKLASAFKINMNEEELMSLMSSMMNTQEVSYDNNLKTLGYATLDEPNQINIYPLSFSDKEVITDFISDYNKKVQQDGSDDKVIQYTDLVGTMMTSVTDIVNMVSYALIAFVAISLVVSSIMIGVITYISVLERKKEIGILRAMGASKRNIRQVFNAETIIIGLLAGCLGVLSAVILSMIANIYVAQAFNVDNIAQLPIVAALVLIGISVFLTYVAGLFPAASAARRDPVEALRSE